MEIYFENRLHTVREFTAQRNSIICHYRFRIFTEMFFSFRCAFTNMIESSEQGFENILQGQPCLKFIYIVILLTLYYLFLFLHGKKKNKFVQFYSICVQCKHKRKSYCICVNDSFTRVFILISNPHSLYFKIITK